jgi:CarD family transcriptional regulator
MAENFNFNIGDRVVYPSHGVGIIIAEESQQIGGQIINVFVISLSKDNMTLRVPVKRAEAVGLRPLSHKDYLNKVFSTLSSRAKTSKGMWSRRAQEYETKINSGDIISIAEVVRDLHKNVDDPDRSYSERIIYESALNRLAGEYAAIEVIEAEKASKLITEFLNEKETSTRRVVLADQA